MKKALKATVGIVLIAAILISSFAVSVSASEPLINYGRDALEGMANGSSLVYVYDKLLDGVVTADVPQDILVRDSAHSVNQNELKTVVGALLSDHPEIFWIKKEWGFSFYGDTQEISKVRFKYHMEGEALETAKTKFNAAVKEMTRGLDAKTEYEKVKILHDRLAVYTDYIYSGFHQTAYGALVDKYAVCAGYSMAYQLLLQTVGINAWTISGESINPITEEKIRHEWNLVRIDGKYYFVDVTWDDQGDDVDSIYYLYFCETTANMASTHFPEKFFADNLPLCTDTQANYFLSNDSFYSAFDADKIAQQLKDGGLTTRIYFDGDPQQFINAFSSNVQTVAQKAGANLSNGHSYRVVGNEIRITLNCKCSHANVTKKYDGEYHWDYCSNCKSNLNKDIHRYSGELTKCVSCSYDYALSSEITYVLSYNANGGSGAPASQSGSNTYTISSAKPVRSGYTFLGWSKNSSAATASYVGGNSITLTENTTLYAVWKSNPVSDPGVQEEDVSVTIVNNRETITIKYGDILNLTAVATNTNATICWYVDGKLEAEGETVAIEGTSKTELEVTVKLVDSSDNVLTDSNGDEISDSETIIVKAGFFQKIISFFKNLFRIDRNIIQ